MAISKNTLWSTDLFPRSSRATGTAEAGSVPGVTVDPAAEAIYLAYANAVLRLAAEAGSSGIRLTELAEKLEKIMPDFDVAELRIALNVLVENKKMLDLVERDRKLGNDLYAVNTRGRAVIRS